MATVEQRNYELNRDHRAHESRSGGSAGLDAAAVLVIALLIWGPLLMGALRTL
jgi:hypothetical protein